MLAWWMKTFPRAEFSFDDGYLAFSIDNNPYVKAFTFDYWLDNGIAWSSDRYRFQYMGQAIGGCPPANFEIFLQVAQDSDLTWILSDQLPPVAWRVENLELLWKRVPKHWFHLHWVVSTGDRRFIMDFLDYYRGPQYKGTPISTTPTRQLEKAVETSVMFCDDSITRMLLDELPPIQDPALLFIPKIAFARCDRQTLQCFHDHRWRLALYRDIIMDNITWHLQKFFDILDIFVAEWLPGQLDTVLDIWPFPEPVGPPIRLSSPWSSLYPDTFLDCLLRRGLLVCEWEESETDRIIIHSPSGARKKMTKWCQDRGLTMKFVE
jgi:hypothetical protein